MVASNSRWGRWGYSQIFGRVAEYLQSIGHSVCYFNGQQIGPPFKNGGIINLGLRYHPWGADVLPSYLHVFNIQVLITGIDLFMQDVSWIPNMVKNAKVVWLAHITANHRPISPYLVKPIMDAHVAVVPSRWGLQVMRESGFIGGDVVYIPHFYDPKNFYPASEEEKLEMKRRLGIEDKTFVLGSCGRNKGDAKNFSGLFLGWKLALENVEGLKRDGILYCVTDPEEPEGWKLLHLRDKMGLQEHVKFVWAKPREDGEMEITWEGDPRGMLHNANMNFPADEMRKFYGCLSAHVISSSAESFSLPCLESQACGIPQIFPNAHIGPELVGEPKSGLLVDIQMARQIPLIADTFMINPLSLANCIGELYKNENLRKELGGNALENSKQYSWDRILPQWGKLVQDFSVPPVSYQTGALGV